MTRLTLWGSGPLPPLDEQWETLKPIITDLYMNKHRKLPEIATELKERYGFNAR
jgi:hypothetical protein